MIAYIKSIRDFSLLLALPVVSYDKLPVAAADADTGQMVLSGEISSEYDGNWLIFDGRVWLISDVVISNGLSTLTLQLPTEVFDRAAFFHEDTVAYDSTEAFIAEQIDSCYKDPGDSFYAMDYLNFAHTGATSFAVPETEDSLYALADYIKRVREPVYSGSGELETPGVECRYGYTNNTLNISIFPREPKNMNVIFGTSGAQLVSRAHDRSMVSKVSVVSPDGISSDYYLTAWGTASLHPSSKRINGTWKVVPSQDGEISIKTAEKVFAENKNSHKIEFYSAETYELYDQVTMRFTDGTVETYAVTGIRISSSDSRYLYVCGDMSVTLTDKLRRIEKKVM